MKKAFLEAVSAAALLALSTTGVFADDPSQVSEQDTDAVTTSPLFLCVDFKSTKYVYSQQLKNLIGPGTITQRDMLIGHLKSMRYLESYSERGLLFENLETRELAPKDNDITNSWDRLCYKKQQDENSKSRTVVSPSTYGGVDILRVVNPEDWNQILATDIPRKDRIDFQIRESLAVTKALAVINASATADTYPEKIVSVKTHLPEALFLTGNMAIFCSRYNFRRDQEICSSITAHYDEFVSNDLPDGAKGAAAGLILTRSANGSLEPIDLDYYREIVSQAQKTTLPEERLDDSLTISDTSKNTPEGLNFNMSY